MERFTSLQQDLADVDTIDGLAPGLAEIAPTVNDRTSRSEGRMQIAGVNPDTLQGFGGFRLEDGSDVRVEDLGPSQVFINTAAAENLEAVPGDTLTVYVYGEPAALTVKGVVSGGGPVGAEPTLLLHLNKAQELFGRVGFINSIVVSNRGDEYTGAELSDEVTRTLRVLFTDREMAVQLKEALSRPDVLEQLELRRQRARISDSLRDDLVRLEEELSGPELSGELVSLFSDDGVRTEFLQAVAATDDEELSREVNTLVVSMAEFVVIDIKRSLLETAEQGGQHCDQLFHPVRSVLDNGRDTADIPDIRDAGRCSALRTRNGPGNRGKAMAPGPDVRF